MSAEFLSLLAGSLLSLVFSYVPGVKDWFEPLDATKKRLIMLGLLVLVAGGVYGLSCAGWGAAYGLNVTCDVPGLQALLGSLILAIIANQSVYAISPKE